MILYFDLLMADRILERVMQHCRAQSDAFAALPLVYWTSGLFAGDSMRKLNQAARHA
jgi:hypothetical protein